MSGKTPALCSHGGGVIGWLACAAMLITTAAYLLGAARCPLAEPDETRYAEIAREMLVRHDWITPHLNFVKYFEKPPLVYWACALAFRILGINQLAARLPSLLAAFGGIILSALLAARMYGRTEAILAVLILATAPLYAILGQTLTLDIGLTFFVTLGLAAVWFGYERGDRRWFRVAWVAVAGGLLVKGPVAAVLVGAPAAVFLLIQGGWPALRSAVAVRGVALAALIVLPWFALVSWRNPEFPFFFIFDQHLKRFVWTTEHREPFWFFLPMLPALFFPWGLLPVVDPRLWWHELSWRRWGARTRFLVLWAAAVVGFFSLSASKMITYVLPASVPLAVLLARMLACGLERGRVQGFARTGWLLLVLGLGTGLAGGLVPVLSSHPRVPLIQPYLYAGGLVLAATGFGARAALRARHPRIPLVVFSAGALGLMVLCSAGHSLANSYRELGRAAASHVRPGDRLAVYQHLVYGIMFYSRHRVIMVSSGGELRFGSQQGDHQAYFWPDDETLRREWAGGGRLFLVINRNELDALRPPLDPAPRLVATEGKKVLIVNSGLF